MCSVPDQLNTYDVLCADDIVFTQGALSTFLAGPTKGKAVQDDIEDVVELVEDAPVVDESKTAKSRRSQACQDDDVAPLRMTRRRPSDHA
jgi:large subunit ribosomal protein L4